MDWQQAAALLIVALTAFLMVRGAVRRRTRFPAGCGGNCGCGREQGAVATPLPKEYLEQEVNEGVSAWKDRKPPR
jgi:hypothetical protein